MVTGKTLSPKEFSETILRKMKLGPMHMDVAHAIYLGDKCKALKLEEIKTHTDKLVEKVMIYFGNTDFEKVNDKHFHQYTTLCKLTAKEFLNEYPTLTIQEICFAVLKGVRKQWGNYDTWNVSLKLFNELIVQYRNSDVRSVVVSTYNKLKEETSPEVSPLSREEEERICMEGKIRQFENFKTQGVQSAFITFRDYDYLLTKCTMPDYKEFLIAAGKIVSKPLKNQASVSEVIYKSMSSKIIYEAKRQAVIKLYTKLVEDNISLKEYMKTV